jgi:hypoxanthine-guanine phosphoribosyltransferase
VVISEVLLPNLKNRDVLVIDIFDTGHTLVEVLAQLLHEPATQVGSADAQG